MDRKRSQPQLFCHIKAESTISASADTYYTVVILGLTISLYLFYYPIQFLFSFSIKRKLFIKAVMDMAEIADASLIKLYIGDGCI